jgi:glycerophosphoryl diester phosphodiesterase
VKKYLILISLFFSLASCERVAYFPDKPIGEAKTFILAHKGGGYFDKGNTLEGCIHGFTSLDGIECDIQRSADNTLWLSHSSLTLPCNNFEEKCFGSLSDNTIINIDSCLGKQINYTRLEAIFSFMSTYYPQKYISLDVKAWTPCNVSGLNITRQMNQLAQEIIDLTVKYHLENHVMVESQTGDFLFYIKTNSDFIETYLTTYGDFELGVSRALDADFSGISFKYKFQEPIVKEQIDLIHRKGLKIQLWTVNNQNDLQEAKDLGADFIQTDNF